MTAIEQLRKLADAVRAYAANPKSAAAWAALKYESNNSERLLAEEDK